MAQAIMADSFDERKRGQAFALYGLVAVLAPSIGPSLGGWITDSYSWRWIFYINIPVGILAYILVTRLVDDPPWIKPDRKHLLNMDYMGLAFLGLAMGGLQIMLDKGEENDWFSSNFIRFFCGMFVVGIVGLICWELQQERSADQSTAVQVQELCHLLLLDDAHWRRAECEHGIAAAVPAATAWIHGDERGTGADGRRVFAGGGDAVLPAMLTGKFPARNIAAVGFCFFAFSFWLTTRDLSLGMSFANASWLRVVQLAPIPFCFIPITTAAYIGIPRQQSNQVAGLINFVRNIGGSIFIALTGAAVTNRDLWHQARLQESMSSLNAPYQQSLQGLNAGLGQAFGKANSPGMASGEIYQQLTQQSGMLGYQDVYKMLFWMAIGMIFFAFMLNKNRPGEGGGGGAMH